MVAFNSLTKFAANFRVFLEDTGIDPEGVLMSIGFQTAEDRTAFIAAATERLERGVARTFKDHPDWFCVHGVKLFVATGVMGKEKKDAG